MQIRAVINEADDRMRVTAIISVSLIVMSLTYGCTNSKRPRLKDEPITAAVAANSSYLLTRGRIIDLTHPFDEQTIYWPTEKGFQLLRGPAGVTEKGYYYAANRFQAAEHGGTHIDFKVMSHCLNTTCRYLRM